MGSEVEAEFGNSSEIKCTKFVHLPKVHFNIV